MIYKCSFENRIILKLPKITAVQIQRKETHIKPTNPRYITPIGWHI